MDSDNVHRDDAVYRSTVVALEGDSPRPPGGAACIKNKLSKCLSRKTLHRRLPCISWMRSYTASCFFGDLLAGFTVGLMLIPQALAYGIVAGLPPNYGLYSAFMGCFVYLFFGSTMDLNIGPTAIMALMTLQYTSNGGPDYAVLLCLISGLIELVAGIINLGFLINFISQPVISGFTSAAAVTIASSQLKPLFGLKLKTEGLLDTWMKVAKNLPNFKWQDLTLGVVCIIILTIMKASRNVRWPCMDPNSRSFGQRALRQVVFYLSVGRNAIIVVIAAVIAFALEGDDQPFTLTGYVEPGVPPAALPPFTTVINNQTMTFPDIMNDVGIGIFMIPFIAILDNIAIVSAFAKGRTFDATQEIIALGLANILGAFFGSMPVTGSLSRTAVNLTSGVRTPAGGLITGIMVLLALWFLTPTFYFIPRATLAAVIICAVLHMVDYEIIMPLWRSKRIDLIPWGITLIACLGWGLEWGILLGIGVNLAMLLYSIATPAVRISVVPPSKQHAGYILVAPSHGVSYPSITHVRSAVRKAGLRQAGGSLPVVIDCAFIDTVDFTSAKGMKGMIEDFQRRGQTLVFVGMKPKLVKIVSALHEGITVCPSFDVLDEILADGQTELPLESLNNDGRHMVMSGGVVVSSMITTPTSDTSEAANPLLSTTVFQDHK
ncbi:sodium-independent sulfate anion transporter-like [Macrobrachium nipponense]|uniref:sodium-independent sulfate anion transporter-like n=1 Tax=Macrobrachium nipponense TaxID=159736 RepID=UPI0030C883F6